ncbi:deleted in malignant brain tumors 1 protein-like [Clarias gariepinus]|uniref:deleted in malignant brain tumors 1 protein-like n=1 Tax=Clarias gariepinus TaxID=13013 RepID=UPI00234CD358|nr:deleted in malignant brain tumors 1 protein-like [Clarias gariepinus]
MWAQAELASDKVSAWARVDSGSLLTPSGCDMGCDVAEPITLVENTDMGTPGIDLGLSPERGWEFTWQCQLRPLQSCCDFIHVYDGPTTQSPFLGSVTGNHRTSFRSSSKYMTVNFASDGHVNQKGFQAKWAFKHSAACGGILHGSGFFSSPYYPNYYHGNTYCVWQLLAPAGQTIFLSFQDLDLDSCCSCDYVKVHDGRSTSSRLIGQLCHSNRSHMNFQSSSSYMTVLFKSDYYGAGRGFKAYFSASLDEITGHVDCFSNRMNIAIRNSYLNTLYIDWEELYLDDRSCKASKDNNYVTFNFSLNSCSTKRKTQDGHIIYSNNVQAAQLTSGGITWRDTTFMLSVSCVMERDSSIGILYEGKEIKNATIRAMGWFNTTMAFYLTESYSNRVTKFPYEVTLNQQLYVQAQLAQPDSSLHLFIDSCVASPNHNFSIRTYDLIRNGCSRGRKVNIYNNGNHYFAKFSFSAFKFLRTHNYAFLRCHLIICADNDYDSRCRQGCSNRSKRSISSDHHTEVITLGPITLKGP